MIAAKSLNPIGTTWINSVPFSNLFSAKAALCNVRGTQRSEKPNFQKPPIVRVQRHLVRDEDHAIWTPLVLGLVLALCICWAYALPNRSRSHQDFCSGSTAPQFAQVNPPSLPGAVQSQDSKRPSDSASVFDKLLSAKTVSVMAFGPSQENKTPGLFGERLASQSLALRTLTEAVRKWGRFTIVDDVTKADLVMVVVEWNEVTKWGKNLQCHDRLFVFAGGTVPTKDSVPLWQIEDGQWGGCSAAARPLKDLRKEMEHAEKHPHGD